MKVIYSNIPPIKNPINSKTLSDYFEEYARQSDEIIIVSGYGSQGGLGEIDSAIDSYSLDNVIVVLGMYYIEGMPENIYNTAKRFNTKWQKNNTGEVRLVKSMKYHGKVYVFRKDGNNIACIVGSHNIGGLHIDANNRRQYELSILLEDKESCDEIYSHVLSVIEQPVSFNLNDVNDVKIIREENTKLQGVEWVNKVSSEVVDDFLQDGTDIVFELPLKVPGIPGSKQEFMGSNINKCYAKGRENKRTGVVKERGWWETEVIVSNKITSDKNYPEKNEPFIVITDDGWKFDVHVSGDYKKNFESHFDLKILGYWLKGRLVAAGIVEPVDSPSKDLEKASEGEDRFESCKGVITYNRLLQYGKTCLTLQKTNKRMNDDEGNERDVWTLSFLPKK